MRLVVVALALVVCACTKQNPAACGDGVCNDPALPFCDTQGTLGGAVNECVAVSCTPGEFAECRGDVSVVCNEAGDNYDLVECVRGCDDATGGCHIDPSNDLGQYFDMVPDPPDIEIVASTIDTSTGAISGLEDVPTFLTAASPGGVAIRLFVGRRIRLSDVEVSASDREVNPALAFLATESITVEGNVRFVFTGLSSAGELRLENCRGGHPMQGMALDADGQVTHRYCSGAGGGGHASAGSRGGNVDIGDPQNNAVGGIGGPVSGTDELVPLRGGCGSSTFEGRGGGALQLTSWGTTRIFGTVDVRGESGHYYTTIGSCEIGGGGAGGGVLLEGHLVELADSAKIVAGGGGGASKQSRGGDQYPGPTGGGGCDVPACGAGGYGAAAMVDATPGQSAVPAAEEFHWTGGGGGGGVGRLRVNSSSGTYARGTLTVEDARVTTGFVRRQ